jgi:acyl transferase domain-containing protein
MESNRPQIGTFTGTGNEASVTCGRVMFSLGFTGASAAIDTACSSSLVAASFALDAARRSFDGLGRVDRAPRTAHAFAAGASLMLTPDMHLTLGGAGMLSHFGRCKVRSIQKFFTHRPVSTFERVPFQLTGELFFLWP